MLSAKTVRAQLLMMKSIMNVCSLETIRKGQNKLGELMESAHRKEAVVKEHTFEKFRGAWVIPADIRRQGVILYLHGGGFACGDLEYAKGFSAMLAARCGIKVFCPGYRLAPENPYPAGLEDCLEAYRYLLEKGYAPEHITLCGESAGGGLCYSLCMLLQQRQLPLPAGIIAISPWVDLRLQGESYETNREKDPSMTRQLLQFYADCYTRQPEDPMVSPLLAQLQGMPPSLIFVGGDEILRSDSEQLHTKLCQSGCVSKLQVEPNRWHGYVLYGLAEDKKDFDNINRFLNRYVAQERKLRWLKLDNAAKIYPAARSQRWSSMFRVSATLKEPVDEAVLQSALDVTARRFPSIAVRLRRGVFWYYLQQLSRAPQILQEHSYPLVRMSRQETRQCAFRVIAYRRRIAVEIFHSVTDGSGALVFLKTLLAEYLQQKYGIAITAEKGVLGRLEEPMEAELEDSFQKYSGPIRAPRRENDAWRLKGTPETAGFLHVTCLQLPAEQLRQKAREAKVSVTAWLCAVMMQALQDLQQQKIPNRRYRKPIRVQIPVNLRRLFPSRTLRNFSLYTTPEINPRLGQYSFQEICQIVWHTMGMEVNAKQMSMKIATNVESERILAVKVLPLFIKNAVMKLIFLLAGERKSCLSLSNLGVVELPKEMEPFIQRMDFILGSQASAPHNCGVITCGDTVYVNMTRNTREPELEACFCRVLRDMDIHVTVRSNSPQRKGD